MKKKVLLKFKMFGFVIVANGFLAFLYPEILSLGDMVTIVGEEKEDNLFLGLMQAKPEQIRFRSKIWEWWQSVSKVTKEG